MGARGNSKRQHRICCAWCHVALAVPLVMLGWPRGGEATEYYPVLGAATQANAPGAATDYPSMIPVVVPRLSGPFHLPPRVTLPGFSAPTLFDLVAPSAPALSLGVNGISNNAFTPPDPILAAGPNDVVALVNGRAGLFSKTGSLTGQTTLNAFFNVPPPADRFAFDPKVLYDPHSERFFAAALEGQDSPDSWLYINVSKSSDPGNLSAGTGGSSDWWGYAIDADLDGGVQINHDWADFTGLGVDAHNLYVTANMFSNRGDFQHVKAWIIPKAELVSGAMPTIFEIGAPPNPTLANPNTGDDDFSIIPAIDFDDGPEHMLATNALSPDGTTGFLTLWTVNDPAGTPTLSAANLPVPSFHNFDFDPTKVACNQKGGGPQLDVGDGRILNVVERNGSVWAAQTQPDATGTRAEARWYQIDPTGPTLVQSGEIADPMRCYFYPAIQPDAFDNACVVMSGVDSSIYGSAFYTCRLVSDPPGTMQSVATLKEGLANYVNDSSGSNRWGDFGGIAADPVTDEIWMFHEYASGFTRWGTWLGKISRLPTPAPTSTPTVTASTTMTASSTATPSETATPTPTETAVASETPTPSPTSTDLPSVTLTATVTLTVVSSPTPNPVQGDVNCDGRVSAADLPALLPLVASGDLGACGLGDVNRDGHVDQLDVAALIERVMSAEPAGA